MWCRADQAPFLLGVSQSPLNKQNNKIKQANYNYRENKKLMILFFLLLLW